MNEEVTNEDEDKIRKIIDKKFQKIFFELFKKRRSWGIMKNLLIETRLFEGKINEDSSGRTIVKGILQRKRNAPNQNERVYPKEILMREL